MVAPWWPRGGASICGGASIYDGEQVSASSAVEKLRTCELVDNPRTCNRPRLAGCCIAAVGVLFVLLVDLAVVAVAPAASVFVVLMSCSSYNDGGPGGGCDDSSRRLAVDSATAPTKDLKWPLSLFGDGSNMTAAGRAPVGVADGGPAVNSLLRNRPDVCCVILNSFFPPSLAPAGRSHVAFVQPRENRPLKRDLSRAGQNSHYDPPAWSEISRLSRASICPWS